MTDRVRVSTTSINPHQPAVDGSVVLQYDWTWTTLIEPSLDRDAAPPDLRYTTLGVGPMQVRHFDYERAAADGAVSVLFRGETPRLLGVVGASVIDVLGATRIAPVYCAIAERIKRALDDPRRKYFLLQELEFNPAYGGLAWSDDLLSHFFGASASRIRHEFLDTLRFRKTDASGSGYRSAEEFQQHLGLELTRRLRVRGDPGAELVFTPLSPAHKKLLSELTDAFRRSLPGDLAECDRYHNDFSAGMLADDITVCGIDPSIVAESAGKHGEPDSSAVMLYAELALAMCEYGQHYPNDPVIAEAAGFWGRLLNSTVQMQAVYFHRYAPSFSDCSSGLLRRPAPTSDYEAVVKPIRDLRPGAGPQPSSGMLPEQELEGLRHRMRCHAVFLSQIGYIRPF